MALRSLTVVLGFLVFCCGCGSNAPTSPTSGTVFHQGTLVIPQTFIADLDQGVIVSNPLGPSDVWFDAESATDWFLSPTGGSIAVMGTVAPGFSGCSTARFSTTPIRMNTLAAGLYLCARTDQERFVEMRVVAIPVPQPPGIDPTLTLSLTTYNN
jgi:hypothetical protein